MQNVVSINKKQKKQKNLKSYPQRKMHSPPHDSDVTAYAIPLNHIATSALNPGRVNDCPDNNVTEIADDIEISGQVYPIMVSWNADTNMWDVKFGCNRTRAVQMLIDRSLDADIPYSEGNKIWASVFTGSPAELNKLQTKENFLVKLPGVSGTPADLVQLVSEAIHLGSLKADRDEVKAHVEENAPAYAGRKFTGIWNALQKTSATLQQKFKTWDKNELAKYFAAHNNIKHSMLKDVPKSGHIVKFGSKKIAVYYVTQLSEVVGALPTNASTKKFITKNPATEVWVVVSLNAATSGTIKNKRDKFVGDIKRWNVNVAKSFDRVLCVPQSESETKQGMLLSGQYPLIESKL